MSIVKGRSIMPAAMLAALALSESVTASAESYATAPPSGAKFRERKPANRPAGSKLARKAARGKL